MNKFFALAIMKDFSLTRLWMNNVMAIAFLQENEGTKIYRSDTSQEATLIKVNGINQIAWLDVLEQTNKVGYYE